MNSIKISFILLVALVVTSCSSIEIFKENTQIPIQKTYSSFVIMNEEVDMNGFSSETIDKEVQILLHEYLEQNGLIYDRQDPDLLIRYSSNENKRERNVGAFPSHYPSYWGYSVWDPWSYRNQNNLKNSEYELLQVIVDFIDPHAEKTLMTLTGVTEVDNPKSKGKKALKTTEKIISYFLTELYGSKNNVHVNK